MDVELKSCPFCGGLPEAPREAKHWTGQRSQLIRVDLLHWCDGASGLPRTQITASGRTHEEAAAAWNTRHGAGDADHSPNVGKMGEDSELLDWLCTGERKMIEDTIDSGWFRVYRDVADVVAEHADWRAMTEDFYPTHREAIRAARAGERG